MVFEKEPEHLDVYHGKPLAEEAVEGHFVVAAFLVVDEGVLLPSSSRAVVALEGVTPLYFSKALGVVEVGLRGLSWMVILELAQPLVLTVVWAFHLQ